MLSVGAQRLDVVYPEGPRDAEGLAVDPLSGDILLVQKTVDRLFSVYRIPSTMWGETQGWAMAEILTGVALPGGTEALMVTQADIDPSGSELFLGTYGAGFRLDLIRQDGRITDLGSPRKAPIYGQGQCEAMSYSHSGLDLYFTCEASPTPLARSACTQRRSNSIPDRSSTDPSPKGRNDLGCHCESTSTPLASGLFYSCFSIGEETNRLEPALSMVAASPRMVRGEESMKRTGIFCWLSAVLCFAACFGASRRSATAGCLRQRRTRT